MVKTAFNCYTCTCIYIPSRTDFFSFFLFSFLFLLLFSVAGDVVTSYSCCQGDAGSSGCCVGKVSGIGPLWRNSLCGSIWDLKEPHPLFTQNLLHSYLQLHVSQSVLSDDGFMTTIVSPLADKNKKVFGLDCEMVSFLRFL